MNQNHFDYEPERDVAEAETSATPPQKRGTIGIWLAVICVVAAISVLLTYTLTNASNREHYSQKLEAQQQTIDRLREELGKPKDDAAFEKLDVLAALFEHYSYYAGQMDEQEMLNAVLKAYAEATGDIYAEYYTEEEYQQLKSENQGDYEGIGVSTIQTTLTVSEYEYSVFQIISIYPNGSAASSDLQLGDMIYAIKSEDTYQLINALGYTKALSMIRGTRGTQAEFMVFRQNGEDYESLEFSITRDVFESVSVQPFLSESNSEIGIVRITGFDLTTPHQFKEAIAALQAQGAQKFVFDVRNNPGGDLQSIKAVLTYFLQKGDLILSSIDAQGAVVRSYYAEAITLTGEYAPCSVAEEEIGMYANLDAVVLCNENTASAAEVFTATFRDYGMATIVGETTYGKGVMQTLLPLSMLGDYSGYVKMTTYAYVTKCGVTYHSVGISPDEGCEVALSEEARKYHFHLLPQELDDQLQMAISQFQ